jgi:hypothetical protein
MRTRAPFILLMAIGIILLYGCTERLSDANQTNATWGAAGNDSNAANGTNAPPPNVTAWPRYSAPGFSFYYLPALSMGEVKNGPNGLISGKHELTERTGEIMAVRYIDAVATYGKNRDTELKANPSKAASDFLLAEKAGDSMDFLSQASSVGNISSFAISREAYGAEAPFRISLSSGTTYTGYAITLYIPERSLFVDVRIVALDSDVAKEMEQQFLLGFSLG